ncbi:MAG: hypothetical protein NC548_06395 [Lachnospiraceae bacterium]|nr:hypothetical protein [Lachnospiraceae bacterium]
MKFIAHWYDNEEIRVTDPTPIEAPNAEEATKEAYRHYDGKPPAPLLWLEQQG